MCACSGVALRHLIPCCFFFVVARAGDRVVATSATLGDVLWEKNTVDGILSAVGTRLVFSNTVTLRVERALDAQQLAAARYPLDFARCV